MDGPIKDSQMDSKMDSELLKELLVSLQNVDVKLEDIRKEHRAALDLLRRDLQEYFLAKAEFATYQQLVTSQFTEHNRRLEKLEGRSDEVITRILAFIAVGTSVLSTLIVVLTHTVVHP